MTDRQVVKTPQAEETKGMTDTIVGAAIGAGVGNVVGPLVSKVTDHLINRPQADQAPPQVVLPPGVDRD